MPRRFYKNFAILASVKPKDHNGGYLFAVVNAFDTVVDLGVRLIPAGRGTASDGTQLQLAFICRADPDQRVVALHRLSNGDAVEGHRVLPGPGFHESVDADCD